MNIEREEEFLNITNINLLVRFNKTGEIFPSVTRVLSIFLTTAATSASVEGVNCKERVTKVPCSIPAASYAQRWALCSNNLANVWVSVKWVEVAERIQGDSLPHHLLSCESWIFAKKKPDRKKNRKSKLCFPTCKNRLSVYEDEERLEMKRFLLYRH